MDAMRVHSPLLPPKKVSCSERIWWRVLHFLAFATGGTTFIGGTAVLYQNAAFMSAVLYIVGSCGFLLVDLMELVTFTDSPAPLRVNISMSAVGSTLYVIGSAGFLPDVFAQSPNLGAIGFIAGSAVIGLSQTWKVARLARDEQSKTCSLHNLFISRDVFTAAGVEASAGCGAYFFLVGTALYAAAYPFALVLALWDLGSIFFTAGSLFMAWRHFVMNIT